MRVNEVRTNKVGVTKSNTKANFANKQAFLALPYVSKTISRVFSVAEKIYNFGSALNKLYNRIPVVKDYKEALAANKRLKASLANLNKGLDTLQESGEVFNNSAASSRKATAKANYKSPEDIRIENLVKKVRLEWELMKHNKVIEDYRNKEIIPRENQLKEVIQSISDSSAK